MLKYNFCIFHYIVVEPDLPIAAVILRNLKKSVSLNY